MIKHTGFRKSVPLLSAVCSLAFLLAACKRAPELPPPTPPRPITLSIVTAPTAIDTPRMKALAPR